MMRSRCLLVGLGVPGGHSYCKSKNMISHLKMVPHFMHVWSASRFSDDVGYQSIRKNKKNASC